MERSGPGRHRPARSPASECPTTPVVTTTTSKPQNIQVPDQRISSPQHVHPQGFYHLLQGAAYRAFRVAYACDFHTHERDLVGDNRTRNSGGGGGGGAAAAVVQLASTGSKLSGSCLWSGSTRGNLLYLLMICRLHHTRSSHKINGGRVADYAVHALRLCWVCSRCDGTVQAGDHCTRIFSGFILVHV